MSRRLLMLAAWVAFTGCGDDEPIRALPDDVDAVVQERCRRCHGAPTAFNAPMSLVTWNDMHRAAPGNSDKRVYEEVARRIDDVNFPMPPYRTAEHDEFTDADRQILQAWVAAGAPAKPEPDAGVQ